MEKYRESLNSEKIKELIEKSRTPPKIEKLEETLLEGQKKLESFLENMRNSTQCRICEGFKQKNAFLERENEILIAGKTEKAKVLKE